jgi:hypothetical protein
MSRVPHLIAASVAAVAIATVTACASRPKEVAVVAPPPEPAPVPVYVTPPISPINRGLSPAATVWHMRVALNVAALACRGAQETTIVQRYNAMLATHKTTLASAETALEAQFRAGGGSWQDRYDDAMTKLYNFFSQAQARDAFCTQASATLAETERLTPGELQSFAAAVLPTLDAPFAEMLAPRPVIAAAAPVSIPVAVPAAVVPRVAAPVHAPPAPAAVTRLATPAPAVGTRTAMPVVAAPAPAVATRAPAAAPAIATRAPRIEVDPSVLRD